MPSRPVFHGMQIARAQHVARPQLHRQNDKAAAAALLALSHAKAQTQRGVAFDSQQGAVSSGYKPQRGAVREPITLAGYSSKRAKQAN